MLDEFAVRFRSTEDQADVMVVLGLSTEGAGSALFLLSSLFGASAGAVAGLGLVCVGAAALFAHLGHPFRFWRVVSKTSTAWISRGAVFTTVLVLLGASSILLPPVGLAALLRPLSLLCALAVMLYAGILYSTMSSIPFWNTLLLPLSFAVHSLTSGATMLLALLRFSSGSGSARLPDVAAVIALLVLSFALTWLFTGATAKSPAARESVRRLTDGPLKGLYVGGALWVGVGAPLALIAFAYLIATAAPLPSAIVLCVAVLIRLAGDFGFRSAVLRAGVYEPVI